MEFAEALEIAVAKLNHPRLRELTDPAHTDFDPGYIELVRQIAEDTENRLLHVDMAPPPAERPAWREQRLLQILVRQCFYRDDVPGCGCHKCWARLGDYPAEPDRSSQDNCERCMAKLLSSKPT